MQRRMKFLSFWSINDGVKTEPLCEQMLQMKEHGIEGVVFHPRFYPGGPDYMTSEFIKVVGEVILYAKSIGMEFWIYDENGWPSGAADGQVLKKHPDSKRWGIAYVNESDILPGDEVLCRHGEKTVVARGSAGVSPLCRETTDTFLELTHERYLRELPAEAFEYVTGFFCDEVDYFPGHLFSEGAVPWCADFESVYMEKYGTSPREELWKLFDVEAEHPEFKVRFWETAGDLIARNFYRPYLAWCESHGKLFTGHLKGEESPYFQLMFSGSCFTQLKGLSLPAIDTLERYHGNHFFPYLLASVAAQQGRGGCLAEAMGGAGWGVAPNDVLKYMRWLAEAGVERVVLHLGQFVLKARAIRDWPPSVPLHLSWHDAFADVLKEARESTESLITAAWNEPKTLIVTPTRGVMAAYRPHHAPKINLHDGTGIPDSESARINSEFLQMVEDCYRSGMRYHFTEERELKNAELKDGMIRVGAMSYEKVLISGGCRFESDEQALVDEMARRGMIIAPPSIKSEECAGEKAEACAPPQSPWKIEFPRENRLLIEWNATPGGDLRAEVKLSGALSPVKLILSDPVVDLRANASVQVDGEKSFVLSGLGDVLTLEIVPDESQPLPFAWLCGNFAVRSLDGWREFDKNQLTCNGDFALEAVGVGRDMRGGELVSSGLPFFGGLVTAKKTIITDRYVKCCLAFDGIVATAVKVNIDGVDIGWWWRDHPICVDLSAGEHAITIAAAPSTYNTYGPHHYYLGDFRLTSPDTFFGRGGYTDDPDAPANTFIDSMQFVKFIIDGDVVLL